MKKRLAAVFTAVLAFAAVFCFAGCESKTAGGNSASSGISYDEKYIEVEDSYTPEDEQQYYIFSQDGTGTYTYYLRFDSERAAAYTVTFNYFVDGDIVNMFYDSVDYRWDHTIVHDVSSKWQRYFKVNKEYMRAIDSGKISFATQAFLDEIPSYAFGY